MIELFKPFWMQILKYGSIIFGIVFVLFRARQSGSHAEQRKQAMDTLAGVKIRDKIENDIFSANDDKYQRLYKKWSK